MCGLLSSAMLLCQLELLQYSEIQYQEVVPIIPHYSTILKPIPIILLSIIIFVKA